MCCYEMKCGPFPTVSPPCGREAYPRDLLVDCVWSGSRELVLWSQKSGDITIATACGDIVVIVSEDFIPSVCDVFVWCSKSFNVTFAMRFLQFVLCSFGVQSRSTSLCHEEV